jgi:predicted nucleotidyltransferase
MEQISYNILSIISKEEGYARDIAKRLKINHMAVQRKLRFFQKQNVVDFKQVGKCNVYFLKKSLEAYEYIKLMEHYKLLFYLNKHPRLRKIVEKLNELKLELVLLFGSYAKNYETTKSDIDIYVRTKDKSVKKILEDLDSKISVKFSDFDTENLLIKEIINDHVILKGVDKYYELIR